MKFGLPLYPQKGKGPTEAADTVITLLLGIFPIKVLKH